MTKPDAEPLSLAELKSHLRIDASDTSQDSLVRALGAAAREHVELFLRRRLCEQTWNLTLDAFPGDTDPGGPVIRIPYPPLSSVSSITYLDTTGASQTLATSVYLVQTATLPGQVSLKYGQSWPSTYSQREAVTVRFVCGYGDPSDVPEAIKAALKLLVADMYERREAQVQGTILTDNPVLDRLLWPYRVVEAL